VRIMEQSWNLFWQLIHQQKISGKQSCQVDKCRYLSWKSTRITWMYWCMEQYRMMACVAGGSRRELPEVSSKTECSSAERMAKQVADRSASGQAATSTAGAALH
jgi:hypothetical protein